MKIDRVKYGLDKVSAIITRDPKDRDALKLELAPYEDERARNAFQELAHDAMDSKKDRAEAFLRDDKTTKVVGFDGHRVAEVFAELDTFKTRVEAMITSLETDVMLKNDVEGYAAIVISNGWGLDKVWHIVSPCDQMQSDETIQATDKLKARNSLLQQITDYQKHWAQAQARIAEGNLDEAMTELLAASAVLATGEVKEKTDALSRQINKRNKRARAIRYAGLAGLCLAGLVVFSLLREKKRRAARSQLAERLHALIAAGSHAGDLAASVPQTPASPGEIKELYRQYLKLGGDAKQFSDGERGFIDSIPPA